MGEVFAAEDTKLGRRVALKVLPLEMASPERRERFEREAKSVAALNHPNIVQVFSVEEADGIHFIVMELVRGKTLTELLSRNGMPLGKFFEMAVPLADAVAAAHGAAITHRDLKPDNVMVGDDGRIKVLDFGLAKPTPAFAEVGSQLPTEAKTRDGAIVGTLAYMSPEQSQGKTVDPRSDIFSLGIIFYEMLSGRRPFEGDTAASLLSSVIKDTPRPLSELLPSLPRELGRIVVKRCLAKDPVRRYQSAIDLRNHLEEAKEDVASGEAFEGATVGPAKASRAGWWVAAAVAVVSAILLLVSRDDVPEPSVIRLANPVQLTSSLGVG